MGKSRSWPACSRDEDNITEEEGHMMDGVPFFSYLARNEHLLLVALAFGLVRYIQRPVSRHSLSSQSAPTLERAIVSR